MNFFFLIKFGEFQISWIKFSEPYDIGQSHKYNIQERKGPKEEVPPTKWGWKRIKTQWKILQGSLKWRAWKEVLQACDRSSEHGSWTVYLGFGDFGRPISPPMIDSCPQKVC